MATNYDGILSLSGGITKRVNSKNDTITIRPVLKFEGATEDDNETTLAFADPTSPRTITFPDADGDVAILESGALPKPISFPVKNPSPTVTLNKGQVVYITGHSGTKPEVGLAKSDSASTMPAFGVVTADIGPEAEGFVTQAGLLKGINTNGFSLGDVLYVSSTSAGALTNTKPTGNSVLLQNIAKVIRLDASNGEILVGGAGRSAATPNLDNGKFFIGDSSNYSSQSLYTLPTSDGNANEVLTTDGAGQVSFQPISNLNVPSFLVYGQDSTLTNQTSAFEMKTTNGSQNGQGWRMPVGGSVTHMSLQLDLENAPTSDIDVVLELYKNGSATGKTLTLTISSGSSIGDFGADGTITAETFSAGDRLTVFINHSASGLQTADHAATIRILTATA